MQTKDRQYLSNNFTKKYAAIAKYFCTLVKKVGLQPASLVRGAWQYNTKANFRVHQPATIYAVCYVTSK